MGTLSARGSSTRTSLRVATFRSGCWRELYFTTTGLKDNGQGECEEGMDGVAVFKTTTTANVFFCFVIEIPILRGYFSEGKKMRVGLVYRRVWWLSCKCWCGVVSPRICSSLLAAETAMYLFR